MILWKRTWRSYMEERYVEHYMGQGIIG